MNKLVKNNLGNLGSVGNLTGSGMYGFLKKKKLVYNYVAN
jgi:hypothetical protein